MNRWSVIFRNQKGGFYLEALVAIALVGIIGATILPLYPRIIRSTSDMQIYSQTMQISENMGEYLFRWTDLSSQYREKKIGDYSNGDALEPTASVSALAFLGDIGGSCLDQEYKTVIHFFEIDPRGRAVARITTWYDGNLNNKIDHPQILNERPVIYSTIVSEKR